MTKIMLAYERNHIESLKILYQKRYGVAFVGRDEEVAQTWERFRKFPVCNADELDERIIQEMRELIDPMITYEACCEPDTMYPNPRDSDRHDSNGDQIDKLTYVLDSALDVLETVTVALETVTATLENVLTNHGEVMGPKALKYRREVVSEARALLVQLNKLKE